MFPLPKSRTAPPSPPPANFFSNHAVNTLQSHTTFWSFCANIFGCFPNLKNKWRERVAAASHVSRSHSPNTSKNSQQTPTQTHKHTHTHTQFFPSSSNISDVSVAHFVLITLRVLNSIKHDICLLLLRLLFVVVVVCCCLLLFVDVDVVIVVACVQKRRSKDGMLRLSNAKHAHAYTHTHTHTHTYHTHTFISTCYQDQQSNYPKFSLSSSPSTKKYVVNISYAFC